MKTFALAIGWFFRIVGFASALFFCMLMLLGLAAGPIGLIYSIYLFFPFAAGGSAAFLLGLFLVNRARKMKSTDDLQFHASAYPPAGVAKSKGAVMNANTPEEHDASEQKQPSTSPSSQQPGGYKPVTWDDIQKSALSQSSPWLMNLGENTRLLVAPLFIVIFFLSQTVPPLAPVTILVLLGCLLARLEARIRNIVAVPMTISAIVLTVHVMQSTSIIPSTFANNPFNTTLSTYGLPWLPIFFAACLLYIPATDSATFKLVMAESFLLLFSGLVPGSGCLIIFLMVYYTLFVAIVIAIFHDIKHYNLGISLSNMAATTH
jgi:hypothetical protein